MAHPRTTIVIALTLCTVAACQPAPGQETGVPAVSAGTPGAAPRTVWGEPDLSGIWVAANLNAKTHNLAVLEALYRPDAKAAIQHMTDVDDPLLRCIPYGIPRAYLSSPWPFQIVQSPGVTVILTDPKMLTGSWTTPKVSLKRAPDGTRIAEAMCFDTTTYSIATAN